MHGFMNDGHTQQWLAVLEQLAVELADVPLLFTGHGAAGRTAPLIAAQIQYLQTYRHHVSKLAGTENALTCEQKNCLEKILCKTYPDYQLKGFIQAGADAVAAELARHSGSQLFHQLL
ncbi:MAG: hypothetical protein HRU20_27470 [Pseudomonadales bacterium]|nr:hypothetical protein [Pseudomonadales bacterium]